MTGEPCLIQQPQPPCVYGSQQPSSNCRAEATHANNESCMSARSTSLLHEAVSTGQRSVKEATAERRGPEANGVSRNYGTRGENIVNSVDDGISVEGSNSRTSSSTNDENANVHELRMMELSECVSLSNFLDCVFHDIRQDLYRNLEALLESGALPNVSTWTNPQGKQNIQSLALRKGESGLTKIETGKQVGLGGIAEKHNECAGEVTENIIQESGGDKEMTLQSDDWDVVRNCLDKIRDSQAEQLLTKAAADKIPVSLTNHNNLPSAIPTATTSASAPTVCSDSFTRRRSPPLMPLSCLPVHVKEVIRQAMSSMLLKASTAYCREPLGSSKKRVRGGSNRNISPGSSCSSLDAGAGPVAGLDVSQPTQEALATTVRQGTKTTKLSTVGFKGEAADVGAMSLGAAGRAIRCVLPRGRMAVLSEGPPLFVLAKEYRNLSEEVQHTYVHTERQAELLGMVLSSLGRFLRSLEVWVDEEGRCVNPVPAQIFGVSSTVKRQKEGPGEGGNDTAPEEGTDDEEIGEDCDDGPRVRPDLPYEAYCYVSCINAVRRKPPGAGRGMLSFESSKDGVENGAATDGAKFFGGGCWYQFKVKWCITKQGDTWETEDNLPGMTERVNQLKRAYNRQHIRLNRLLSGLQSLSAMHGSKPPCLDTTPLSNSLVSHRRGRGRSAVAASSTSRALPLHKDRQGSPQLDAEISPRKRGRPSRGGVRCRGGRGGGSRLSINSSEADTGEHICEIKPGTRDLQNETEYTKDVGVSIDDSDFFPM